MMLPTEAQAKRIDDEAERVLTRHLVAQQWKRDMFIAFNTGRIDPTPNGNRIGRGLGDDVQGKAASRYSVSNKDSV